jgi:hypothetical protein
LSAHDRVGEIVNDRSRPLLTSCEAASGHFNRWTLPLRTLHKAEQRRGSRNPMPTFNVATTTGHNNVAVMRANA